MIRISKYFKLDSLRWYYPDQVNGFVLSHFVWIKVAPLTPNNTKIKPKKNKSLHFIEYFMHYLPLNIFEQKMSNKTVNLHELNLRVILIGIALSIIMGSANVYLGLKAGMTVSASIPAAVIGMLTLRYISFFFKHSEKDFILEANQIQTAASAGESLAAGIIFTMPALILIGVWEEFDIILQL